MNRTDELEDPRRRRLIQVLTGSFLAATFPAALAESLFGDHPQRLPAGRCIYRLNGAASINGKRANSHSLIRPGDTIETAADSELIFALPSGHAMILRANSHLTLETGKGAGSALLAGLRLLTGKLLSVSRNVHLQVTTATTAIGIRGTGFYVESDPELTYFCTCYGVTDVSAITDAQSKTTVVSKHHDRPLYITTGGPPGGNIRSAPFINHTDQELALIEALVGRTVPFVFESDTYSAPRREY